MFYVRLDRDKILQALLSKVPKLGFHKFVARICERVCFVISRDCA